MAFGGFPRNVRATPVPDPVFNSLLEEIEDPAELKVTLRLIWLLGQKRGQVRFVAESELLNDATLIRGLQILGGDPRERIRQGLNLALTRGTLLRHDQPDAASNRFYLLNTEDNRRRLEIASHWSKRRAVARRIRSMSRKSMPAGSPAAKPAFTTFTRTTSAPSARCWRNSWRKPRKAIHPGGLKKPSD